MSKRVVTCGCAVVHLDHEPSEPTIFDIVYEAIKHPFSSKPNISRVSYRTHNQKGSYALLRNHA